jgi:hypothetical protein
MHLYIGALTLASLSLSAAPKQSSPPSSPTGYPPIAERNGRADSPGADLNLDYLYWTAREDSLEYAYNGVAQNSSQNAEPGKIFHPHSQWQSGYKIGLAAYTAYDGWDVYGLYTWFKLSTQANQSHVSNLKPTWKITNFNATTLSFAANNWSLDFNVFDFLLRRKFYLSPKFEVQAEMGFKASWQKQTYMTTYDSATNASSGIMKIRQKTDGLGIGAACSTNWYITKPVSVVGRLGVSTLWFQSKAHRVDTVEDTVSYYNSLNTKQELSYAAPVIETFLGLSFESSLYKKKIQAIFQAGYEFQIWFDANQFERTILDANGSLGNLNLQGLTLRGQIEF